MQRTSPVLVSVSYGAKADAGEALKKLKLRSSAQERNPRIILELCNIGTLQRSKKIERVDPVSHLESSSLRLTKN